MVVQQRAQAPQLFGVQDDLRPGCQPLVHHRRRLGERQWEFATGINVYCPLSRMSS
jgi:hypothetical protein